MKAKDKQKLNVIKGILSDLTYAEKSQLLPPSNTAAAAAAGSVGSTPPSFSKDNDSDVATIIQKSIKKRQESIESFQNNGRPELADAEKQEVEILSSYLPKQLSDGEIEAIALVTVKRLLEAKKISGGIKSMGVVMKELDIDTARAPKSRVAGIVKKLLSSSMS
ncbi:hypothetical protein H4219_005587 [Mycoemilia scoparia]|uniref:Altered inheritance of mitochondria protein 41 n=1 Tax=Mycoemilia scoparia TaxID=417184 RepID=A0A9W7ZU05_9FUNG|nr:hypothetical protein H4219_005587 [Mycoemilia scoparia]